MASTTFPAAGPSDGHLYGSQVPRIRSVPDSVSSAGQEVVELAALAGLDLDPWEADVLRDALGVHSDGKWAAFEVGVVVPRQNGKGSIYEARELGGLFIFADSLLIHSAHEQATSSEHFLRLLNLIEGTPDLDQRVRKVSRGKGAEAIELKNGSRILFKTRTGGGGRGLTGDFVGLDEAMILPVATTSALVPTMAARSVTGNPQLWYAGSAVDQQEQDHGIVLARLRERGLRGDPHVAYFEFSAPGDSPDKLTEEDRADRELWAMANPGLGIRISEEHIALEHGGALGPRGFAVERLGVGDWPSTDPDGASVIAPEAWKALTDPDSSITGDLVFAADTTPDRSRSVIAVAGRRADGLRHVEVVESRPGTGWVADRLAELVEQHRPLALAFDTAGPIGSLSTALEALECDTLTVNAREQAEACGLFYDAVEQAKLRHLGTPDLTSAVRGAVKRTLGDAWAWSRKSSAVDISPLVACTLALWGYEERSGMNAEPLVAWR